VLYEFEFVLIEMSFTYFCWNMCEKLKLTDSKKKENFDKISYSYTNI